MDEAMNVTRATLTILTQTTCGEACWEAREEICRCSCNGRNHGILRAGGPRPDRTCKIDGYRYMLKGVGPGTFEIAQEITWLDGSIYYYDCNLRRGAAARHKAASENQRKWQEVQPFLDPSNTPAYRRTTTYLLCVREDKAALYDKAVQNFKDGTDRRSLEKKKAAAYKPGAKVWDDEKREWVLMQPPEGLTERENAVLQDGANGSCPECGSTLSQKDAGLVVCVNCDWSNVAALEGV